MTRLEERAPSASSNERAAWWKRMLALGVAERVVGMAAEGLLGPRRGGALLEAYVRALAQLGDHRSFAAVLN